MKEPTYGPLAESLLFELTRLGLDQPAPELVGRDADGREFPWAIIAAGWSC